MSSDDESDEESDLHNLFKPQNASIKKSNVKELFPSKITVPFHKFTPEIVEYMQLFPKLLENIIKNDMGKDIKEFTNFNRNEQKSIIKSLKSVIKNEVDNEKHPYFKILQSTLPDDVKKVALDKQIQVMMTEPSSGEHNKIKHWINGLMKIPFNNHKPLPKITKTNPTKFITNADKTLNDCCYGMKDAKDHVIR